MGAPNSTVDLRKAMAVRLMAVRELCIKTAAEAEQWAKDRADEGARKKKKTGGGDEEERPVKWTAAMLAEAEKKKEEGDREPWERLTGQARRMIKGSLIDEETEGGGGVLGFRLAHRVSYGAYLEYAHSGKHAVLRPALEHFRAGFLETAKEIIGGSK